MEFQRSDFALKKVIGEGGYGRVYYSLHKDSGKPVALKAIMKKSFTSRSSAQCILREKRIFATIINKAENPFIIHLYGICQTRSCILFIFELATGGDLAQLMKNVNLTESDAQFYGGSILLAIEFLHSKSVVHRDLKPQNVFLTSEGQVKIGDFGLSRDRITPAKFLKSMVGTPGYHAPEILDDYPSYNFSVDYWSLGILIFEMLVNEIPFRVPSRAYESDDEYFDRVSDAIKTQRLRLRTSFSENLRHLLKRLLEKEPNNRISTAIQVKDHPFFKDFDWVLLSQGRKRAPYPSPRFSQCPSKYDSLEDEIDRLPYCSRKNISARMNKMHQNVFREINFVSQKWSKFLQEAAADEGSKSKKVLKRSRGESSNYEAEDLKRGRQSSPSETEEVAEVIQMTYS